MKGSTNGVLDDRRASESGSGDHHKPSSHLPPTSQFLQGAATPLELVEKQHSATTHPDAAKGSAPRSKPDRKDSMSSDSHYSDDSASEGTEESDLEADRLLAQADSGPLSGQR
jgi:hypothetical protein